DVALEPAREAAGTNICAGLNICRRRLLSPKLRLLSPRLRLLSPRICGVLRGLTPPARRAIRWQLDDRQLTRHGWRLILDKWGFGATTGARRRHDVSCSLRPQLGAARPLRGLASF